MATWNDVKDAWAADREVDARVLAKLDELKAKIVDLSNISAGPGSDEFEAVVADMHAHTEAVMAALEEKAGEPELPVPPETEEDKFHAKGM